MRPYQVVVWGATGFVGKLVCEHVARDYKDAFTWAIAGRTPGKLEAVRDNLAEINPKLKDMHIVVADLKEPETVTKLVQSTDVLITTVGPYTLHGLPIVEACAKHGTHYCDLTGEPNFVRASMRAHNSTAKASGARIVHSCGYDSVPSDVSALLAVHAMQDRFAQPVADICTLQKMKGGGSGGTIESLLTVLKQDGSVLRDIQNPYCLDPPGSHYLEAGGPDSSDSLLPYWSAAAGCWTAPFVMAMYNCPLVRRSNALLGYTYGSYFKYSERQRSSSWLAAFFTGTLPLLLIGGVLAAAAKFAWLRRRLPMPGSGPSKDTQLSGSFSTTACAVGDAGAGKKRGRVVAQVADHNRDPGYWSTSRMLLEAALCMALQQEELAKDPYASKCPAGVLTPASGLGLVLAERLKAAGYAIDVSSDSGATQTK